MPYVPHVPCVIRAPVSHVSLALRAVVPHESRASRALVLHLLSWLTCSRVLHASCHSVHVPRTLRLRVLVPDVSCALRVLGLLLPRALSALVLLVPDLLQVFQT